MGKSRLLRGIGLALVLVLGVMMPAHAAAKPDEIRVALPLDYLPLSDLNILGEPSGMLPEIWRLWSKKTGVRVNFLTGDFADTVDMLRDGRADVHGSLFRNDDRDGWLGFTRPFHEAVSGAYVLRSTGAVASIDAFRGKTVGVLGSTHQEGFLRESEYGFNVLPFRDPVEMLRALAQGEIDLLVHEELSMDSLLNRTGLLGDVTRIPGEIMRKAVFAAVKKERADLLALVDFGLAEIGYGEYAEIEKQWIADSANRLFPLPGSTVPLNTREREWLAENKVVRVGVQSQWPPMASVEGNNVPVGMSIEFIKLINKNLGGNMVLVPGKWTDLLADVREKRLDAVIDLSPSLSRMGDYQFSNPYLVIQHVVVGKTGSPVLEGLGSVAGKTLAIETGYHTNEFIRTSHPEIKILEVPDTLSALKAVAEGRADAWIGNRAVARYNIDLHEKDLSDLQIGADVEGRASVLAVGVRNDWSVFRNIVNKAITGITPAQRRQITEPWLSGKLGDNIELSVGEQRWLARFRENKIRVLVDDWPPFNHFENGEASGMAVDYLRYAFGVLGLQADFVNIPWPEALAGIQEFDKVDLIAAISPSPERQKFLAFTKPYLTFPNVIFVRDDADLISGLDDLNGKTVAIERDFILDARLTSDYPNIKLLRFPTTHEAIEAVSLGKAIAYVGNLAAGTWHIQKHGFANLKVGSPTSYAHDDQAMGVRSDWPELASMLDKVLDQMTDEQHTKIRSAALAVKYETGIDIQEILTYALPVGAVVIVIIVVIVIANRKLADREAWFKSLLESAPDATVIVNAKGDIVQFNRQAEILFGVNREDVIGQKIERLVPDSIRDRHVGYRHGFVTATAPREMAANMKLMARRWNGDEIPVEISLSPIKTKGGTLISASVRDVTERREAEAELARKDLQLTAALENMSGGMFMIDTDQIIRVFNRKFVELYQLPEVRVGMPLRDIMMVRAARGDYGPGDPDEIIAERIEDYRSRTAKRVEDRVAGNTIIESYRQPTSDGGMVCIFNDITVRKKAEEALAAQTRTLQQLSKTLSRYLSPQIYEAIFAGASDANVRTARKKLTVFFSDIKNFTATTEEMEPEDMTYLLNDYLTKMTEIALEHGGTIDKYIGDAIMVFFGDPESKGVKEDALAAVRMAVAMQRRMVDLRAKWADMGYRLPFHIRCGVNTGYCNVGNFGSEQRVDYTIIGGQVNLAARLESICPPDGVTIAHETYTLVRDEFEAEPMPPIEVKGIRDPVEPYSISNIFEDWDETERYIRRDDVRGLRVWVDLARMTEEQRRESIAELEEVLEILRLRKIADNSAAD